MAAEPERVRGDQCAPLLAGGGYDCEFVDSIPDSLSCSVCLLAFRNPHLLDCCGIKLCEVCVVRIEAAGQPCPYCRSDNYKHIADPSIRRQVLGKQVYCERRNKGCEWVGELRHLEEHRIKECGWAMVQCRYHCSDQVIRHQLAQHELEECPQRPMEVKLESFMRRMDERHKKELVAIREEYATKIEQLERRITDQQTEHDKKIADQMTKIEQLERRITDQQKWYEAKIDQIVVAQSIKKLAVLKREVTKRQVMKLDKETEKILPQCDGARLLYKVSPIEFIISDYCKLKQRSVAWCSAPFYSGPEGYKFCLKVVHLLSTCIMTLYLLKGDNDGNLKWPLSGCVTIQLVNQKSDQDHLEHIYTLSKVKKPSIEIAFVLTHEIQVRYISSDRLVIRVIKINVH